MDTFYKVGNLPIEKKLEILNKAIEYSHNIRIDKLDCSNVRGRYRRVPIDMPLEEMLAKFDYKCHFSVVERTLYDVGGEVVFRTMGGKIDYFLWVYLTLEKLEELVKLFNLGEM